MTKRQTDPLERFFSRFIQSAPDECWAWTGSRLPMGYGMFWPYGTAGGKQYAHRFSYEHFIGPIPEGCEVDHLCGNKWCVNPAHLEAVSRLVNMRRANGWTINEAGLWRCRNGHAMPAESMGGSSCRECFNAYKSEWRSGAGHKEQSSSYGAQWSRRQKRLQFLAEHPALEAEAEALGLPLARRRLNANWTYDTDGWIQPNGIRVPFGFGPLRS